MENARQANGAPLGIEFDTSPVVMLACKALSSTGMSECR